MKTSKVIEVLGAREFQGKHGAVFYHDIVLENGDAGSVGKKKSGAIAVGDTINYTIDGQRISLVYPTRSARGGFSNRDPGAIAAAVALKAATHITVANIQAAGQPLGMNGELTTKITNLADGLYEWLRTKENER